MWCAVNSFGILGPYLFEDLNGNHVNVNQHNYLDMLRTKFLPDLQTFQRQNPHLNHDWIFMQDGASPHTTILLRQFLNTQFPNRTIGRNLNTDWPPRSPDMTPCDFFLWGWLKDQVYRQYPIQGLNDLKTKVFTIMAGINGNFARNACRSVKKRMEKLQTVNGRQFEHLL